MTLGFEQAGFDVLTSVEIDPIHCATHEYNFPFWPVICADIAGISGADIRQRVALGKRDIDVVFGGPPCQGFSLIGKRELDDPRNSLVRHFLRLVLELRPKFFVMENVPGLVTGRHKGILTDLISSFFENGYTVEHDYQVLNAAEFGVPQNRRRLFLLGCRRGRKLPQYPIPTTRPAGSSGRMCASGRTLPSGPTVFDAIGDLPEVEEYEELLKRDWIIAKYSRASDYARALRRDGNGRGLHSYPRSWDSRKMTSSLRTVHTPRSIRRFAATKHGGTELVSRFHKLDPRGVCNTLRAGTGSNKGAFTSPRPIHPFTPRCITVREAARLHGYPDWFRFHATKWHGFRQVGNSVPPPLARAVAAEVMRACGCRSTKPRRKGTLGNESLLRLNMREAAERYGVDPGIMGSRTRTTACTSDDR